MFRDQKTFNLGASGSTISQTFDVTTYPKLFSKQSQWRIYTASQTDVKSWEISFVGAKGPTVDYSDSPAVASFTMENSLPCMPLRPPLR
jgi:hypothetical protein